MKAPLAACLLALCPALGSAEFDTKVLDGHIQGCSDNQKEKIKAAVKMAFDDYAGGCLIDGGLNSELGQKIQTLISKGELTYQCSTESHEFSPPSTVNLRVSDSPGAPSAAAGLVVLHEMIHGVDPGDDRVTSLGLHNLGSFPDGVFGCHVACMGKLGSTKPMEWVSVVEAATGSTLVSMDWDRCAESDKSLCRTVGQYASLCQNGAVPAKSFQRPLGDLPVVFCLIQKLKKGACGDSACDAAKANLGGLIGGSTSPQDSLGQLSRLLFRTLDSKRNPSDPAAQNEIGPLGKALISQGVVDACESNPEEN